MITFKRLDHVLITVPEQQSEAARYFYGTLLGLKEIPGQHPKGAIWFNIGDIELHITEEGGNYKSDRHPAFEVASLNDAKQFLKEQNVEVQYASEIVGRQRCFFRDPFGNRFELVEFNP
jgi:catechol 2,3-dioxygenase-like lactoylglutathione lyase family enzyme